MNWWSGGLPHTSVKRPSLFAFLRFNLRLSFHSTGPFGLSHLSHSVCYNITCLITSSITTLGSLKTHKCISPSGFWEMYITIPSFEKVDALRDYWDLKFSVDILGFNNFGRWCTVAFLFRAHVVGYILNTENVWLVAGNPSTSGGGAANLSSELLENKSMKTAA